MAKEVCIPVLKKLRTQQNLDSLNSVNGLQKYTGAPNDIIVDLDVKVDGHIKGVDKRVSFNTTAIKRLNKYLVQKEAYFEEMDVYYARHSEMSFPSNLKSFEQRNNAIPNY